jgi:hypothetical protein
MSNKRSIENKVLSAVRIYWKIKSRYDPEYDLDTKGITVNWAEMDLADAVNELAKAVIELSEKVFGADEEGAITWISTEK